MPKLKLTERSIETYLKRAQKAKAATYLWDTQEPGLGCRVSATGHVSWMVQVWWNGRGGKAKRYTFPATDLEDARGQAPEHRAKLLKKVDLVKLRDGEREASREADSKRKSTKLEAVVKDYLAIKSEPGRFWKELETRFENEIIPHFDKDTAVGDISKADVRRLIRAKQAEGHPVAARTLYEALRPFFRWCADEDIIPASPMDSLAAPPVPQSRDRTLTEEEIKAFWSATSDFKQFGPFYRLLLLTAQRREEVGAMQWAEIKGEEWHIPKERTKNGKKHIVHLSPQAQAILEAQPHLGPFVFGKTGESPISGYSKAKRRLDERMGLSDWRVHDLRRTARTGFAMLKVPKEVASKVLNHSPGGKDKLDVVYNQYDYFDERKAALEKWACYIERLVGGAPEKNNVVPLRA